jgi:hypothetical protein
MTSHIQNRNQLIWQLILFLAISFEAFEVPLTLTFGLKVLPWQLFLDGIFSIVFSLDLYLNFKERKKLKKKNKLQNSFIIVLDLLAIIPFDLMGGEVNVLNILSAYKLIRIARFIPILQIIFGVQNITAVPTWLKNIFGAVLTLILVHWISCIWIILEPVHGKNLDNVSNYVKSLYFTTTTLTTIGYGDITPTHTISRIFTMMIQILGVGLYGVVIGNVSRLLTQADRYKEQSKNKIQDLQAFFKHYAIPLATQKEIFSYYEHLITKRLSDNDHMIISQLPTPIQKELQIYMSIKLINNIPFFNRSGAECMRKVAQSLEQEHYSPGDYIIKIDDEASEMFIIGHGEADVTLADGKVVAHLTEGEYFGEIALVESRRRTANVVASNFCDIYKLKKDVFLDLIKSYPKLLDEVQQTIDARKGIKKN